MPVESRLTGGAIHFKNVVKKYGDQTVVDDLDLQIEPGEFFSLLGPSGSGKTTTLMLLAGFAALDKGHIYLGRRDIGRMTPQERNLGMVFQNYALFPHMTVLENVMFPLKVRKLPKQECIKRARWAIELVRLQDFATRQPKQLSGGQQQRVALARAIVFHPEVVLMDEPLGALDKNLRYQMQMEIKALQKELGMTVVFVTHDQEEAMNMSDRIAIMNGGRIQQVGTPQDVYQNPANKFTAGFLGEANFVSDGDTDSAFLARHGVTAGHCLFIRPERLQVLAPAEAQNAQLQARIENVSFLGSTVRYQLQLATGKLLYADTPNLSGRPVFNVGERVHLGWRAADDIRVISND